jgi:hypothetical protein
MLLLTLLCSAPAFAGPLRNSTVTPTPGSHINTAALNEDPTSNFCKVEVGPDKKTWVEGHGEILILPSGTRWTQEYTVWGWDRMVRQCDITGCEVGHWDWSATVWMTVKAEAAIAGSGTVKAVAYGKLQAWQNGSIIGEDYRECTVANSGTTGQYDFTTYDGVNHPNCGYWQVTSGTATATATQLCLVTVPNHSVNGLNLNIKYLDFGWVELHTNTDSGHTKSDVYHETYTLPNGTSTTNTWKVKLTSWDDDTIPAIKIHDYDYDGDVDQ